MSNYSPEGMRLYKNENRSGIFSPAQLHDALQRGSILEARALLCDNEHNLHVDLGSMRGIIPKNECAIGISDGTVRDIAIISRVNKPVCFKVTGIEQNDDGTYFAALSRRLAQEECMSGFIAKLTVGDVINAAVTHLEPFGAFCDIGCGICALLPIDGISVSRIPHPNVRFKAGKHIKAIVRGIDENGRITLTHKELLGTWEENAALFSVGQTVPGVVRSVENYGIFVELTPNLAGLAELTDGIREGQHCSVFIKNIIPEKMKLKLVIVDSFNADYPEENEKYFFEGTHMNEFIYSPDCCEKRAESLFSLTEAEHGGFGT